MVAVGQELEVQILKITPAEGDKGRDMIAALALKNLGGIYSHAPTAIRSDRFAPQGVRLRYVQCPQAPFLDSNEQNVCEGL